MRIVVPAGQGDFVFMFAKLYSVRKEIDSWGIVDGWPYRTKEFIELCDPGKPVDYEKQIGYQTILQFEQLHEIGWQHAPTWEKVRSIQAANVLLEANAHLEHGLPVADWLPDLPTHHNFPLHVPLRERESARKKVMRVMKEHPMKEGPVVGISCASYRGAEAWKTWGRVEWVDFLKKVMQLGWRPLLMGGNWDDLTYSVACELELPDIVGKTSVPEMVDVLSILDSYIGFSSGMTMTRTVLDLPAMAFWPDFQEALSTSWAPPHMLDSRRYMAHLWRPVEVVWPVARAFLRLCEKEHARRLAESDMAISPSLSRLLADGYNGSAEAAK